MQSVLIIGTSRGLGLEFVRQYRQDGWLTIATCRSPAHYPLITSTGASAIQLDVTSPETYQALAHALDGVGIDVCIYNAGVFGTRENISQPPDIETFNQVMQANVFGAMQMMPIVMPALAKARGKLVVISSMMGSISRMANSGAPLYRASKAAANAAMKSASIEYGGQGVTTFSMHPGWVKTDMGGSDADMIPADSIRDMRRVIANATPEANGTFFNHDGSTLPW